MLDDVMDAKTRWLSLKTNDMLQCGKVTYIEIAWHYLNRRTKVFKLEDDVA